MRTKDEQKKEALGLNRPLAIQYMEYLWQVCRLDFGESMVFKQRVSKAIIEKLPATIELTFFGMLITLILGVFMGAYAADKRRTGRENNSARVRVGVDNDPDQFRETG